MPSLNDVTPGSSADSSCIQQVVDMLKGTAGKGIPASLTAVSDAANWALDVKNNEAVNSRTFRAVRANGTVLIQADVNGVQVSSTGGAPATVVNISDTQTLTNKTLTAPTIVSAATISSGGYLVGAEASAPHYYPRAVSLPSTAFVQIGLSTVANSVLVIADSQGHNAIIGLQGGNHLTNILAQGGAGVAYTTVVGGAGTVNFVWNTAQYMAENKSGGPVTLSVTELGV